MTGEPQTPTPCTWCHRPGHVEGDHPLPNDHPQYDAFNDASDDELADMVSNAVWPDGRPLHRDSAA